MGLSRIFFPCVKNSNNDTYMDILPPSAPFDADVQARIETITARVAPEPHDHESGALGFSLYIRGGVFDPAKGRSAQKMAQAITLVPPRAGDKVLDMGTGSGILALFAQKTTPSVDLHAVDAMPHAVESAAINFQRAGIRARVDVSDLFSAAQGPYDYIIFNAPSAHPSLRAGTPGDRTLWDSSQSLKHRFMAAVRSHINDTNPHAKILMMYAEYRDFRPLDHLDVDGFAVSRLLIDRDDLSEAGVLLLTKPTLR